MIRVLATLCLQLLHCSLLFLIAKEGDMNIGFAGHKITEHPSFFDITNSTSLLSQDLDINLNMECLIHFKSVLFQYQSPKL